jgi:hypothetical protein
MTTDKYYITATYEFPPLFFTVGIGIEIPIVRKNIRNQRRRRPWDTVAK